MIRVSLETRAVLITNLRPRTINSEQLPTRVARDVRQPPLHALAGEGREAVNTVDPATVFTRKHKLRGNSVYRKSNSAYMKTMLGEQCLQMFQQHLQKKHYSQRTVFAEKTSPPCLPPPPCRRAVRGHLLVSCTISSTR